jgi:hypothetical protein
MRDAALLGARLLLGGYMGIHAAQKLFGAFHGPGLDGIGAAGALIATMVPSKPAPAEADPEPSAADA